jgi:hypothetical protein
MSDVWKISTEKLKLQAEWSFVEALKRIPLIFDVDLIIEAFKCHKRLIKFGKPPSVRANSLYKLENRNWTRLVQKPTWTRFMGKSENVYSVTRTLCLFDRGKTRKSVYRSTTFHFLPLNLVQFGFCTNLVQFCFFCLNKVVERTDRGILCFSRRGRNIVRISFFRH